MSAVYSRYFLLLLPAGISAASGSDTGTGADTATVAVRISPFPTNAVVLDNFNRANEGPPPTGWTDSPGGAVGLIVLSNQLAGDDTSANAAYFNTSQPADIEAYITLATLGAATTQTRLYVRQDPTTGGVGASGYRISYTVGGNLSLARSDANVLTAFLSTTEFTLASGDAIGIRCVGSVIEGWVRISGVWKMFASVIDTTYSGASPNNKVMVYITGNSVDALTRDDDLTGGAPNYNSGAAPGADVGTSSENATVAVALPVTETGTGADTASVSIVTPVSGSDSGTGSEVLSRALEITDAGTTSDASVFVAADTQADTGAGVDTSATTAVLSGAETGTGADTASVTIATQVSGSDSGTGSEIVSRVIQATETGTGAETATPAFSTTVTDTGVGSDASTLTASLSLSESGIGSDTAAISVPVSGADSGSGVDAGILTATYTATDSGTGAETSTSSASVTGTDTGTDSEVIPVIRITTSDTGTSTETPVLTFAVTVTDSGSGSDTQTLQAGNTFTGTDSFSGVDAISTFTRELPESSAGVENQLISLILTDSGSGVSENFSIALVLIETGSFSDASIVEKRAVETGAGTDSAFLVITGTETGTGVDASTLVARFTVTELMIADEAYSIDSLNMKTGSDSGDGFDILSTFSRAVAESATGTDLGIFSPRGTDSGAGSDTGLLSIFVFDFGTGLDFSAFGTPLTGNDYGVGVDRAYNNGKAGTGTRKAILIDASPGTSGRQSRLVTTKQRSKITA